MSPIVPSTDSLFRDKGGNSRHNDNNADKGRQLCEVRTNLATICVVWVFTWTAYSGLQYLVIAMDNDTGNTTLGAIFGGSSVTFILGPYILHKVSPKRALLFSWICLLVFGAANYRPKGGILIPAGLVEGIGYGLMWTAQGVYLTTEATRYAIITGTSFEGVLNVMWGVFNMALESTLIWQNLVTPSVLATLDIDRSPPQHEYPCGVDVCPDDMVAKVSTPNDTLVTNTTISNQTGSGSGDLDLVTPRERSLITIYLAFTVVGLAATVFFLQQLQPVPSAPKGDKHDDHNHQSAQLPPPPSNKELLLSTLKMQTLNKDMVLLVPLCLYSGIQQTVILGEYSKYFVLCRLGFGWYVFPLICFGSSGVIASLLSSTFGQSIRRPVQFAIAAVLNLILLVVLLLWTPTADQKFIFFFLPIVWGVSEGIWLTQSSVLFSSLFVDLQAPAFASYRMLQYTGQSFAYKLVKDACVDTVLYFYLASLIVCVVSTATMEVRLRRRQNSKCYQELDD